MPHEPISARPRRQTRQSNPNGGGGRVVASNGYVLIRVGVEHPLADVRGYAYEHRLVASRMLDRWLKSSEQVHHKNEIKTDNRPENLEVCSGLAEHRVKHRKPDSRLRVPGEDNPVVECGCGCGGTFPYYDATGRLRVYISGHNPQPAPTAETILAILDRLGPLTRGEIANLAGITIEVAAVTLSKLKRRNLARTVSRGVWAKGGS